MGDRTYSSGLDDPAWRRPASTPTPPVKPLLCRLNLHHKWRMEYPADAPAYGWCIRCRKVNPTGNGWEWKDILWMEFPGGISSASSFTTNLGREGDWGRDEGSDGGAGDDAGGGDGGGGDEGGD